jgi:hypothetical protein
MALELEVGEVHHAGRGDAGGTLGAAEREEHAEDEGEDGHGVIVMAL